MTMAAAAAAVSVTSAVGQKVFDRFDTDKSGLLDIGEVKEALKILVGKEVPADKFDHAMKKFDGDQSGHLDVTEFGQLVNHLREARKEFVDPPIVPHVGSILGRDRKLPCQDRVLHIYQNKAIVLFIACCIMGNFIINILEKQMDPDTKNLQYPEVWAIADIVFNIIFLFELIANMWSYGGPVRKFWSSGWNVFDTIIVTVGVLSMVNVLGPPLNKIKLMRAFRVFRLFKRIESLNKIIVALLNSIPGVTNAFVVMVVFFCIYAILAVELFRDFGEGGVYTTFDSLTGGNNTIDAVSQRGYILGIEYYGTFMRALYTLFQVMTGESWSEAVVRPLIFGLYQNDAMVVGFFFVSFIILTQLVLINVVVAVLLENFVTNEEVPEDDEALVEERIKALDDAAASTGTLGDISSKLDKLICSVARLENLEGSVTELKVKMAGFSESMIVIEADVHSLREERVPMERTPLRLL